MKLINRLLVILIINAVLIANAQDETWLAISIPDICNFKIPPSLELQKGKYKEVRDQYMKLLEITTSPDIVTVQPKGINDLDPKAFEKYCRIIVETQRGHIGDYSKLDESINLSEKDLNEIDQQSRDQINQQFAALNSKGQKNIILSWKTVRVAKFNGIDTILIEYIRILNDYPPVFVRTYNIQNNDCMHAVTISYRENEKNIWAQDMENIITTFKFKKR